MTTPTETVLDSRLGRLELHRFPVRPSSTLRAWDAADDYVLDAVADLVLPEQPSCLVVGDRFGAIALGLAAGLEGAAITSMSDSWLAHQGLAANLARNGMAPDRVAALRSIDAPTPPLDLVVVKVPRSIALLEDQLRRLRPALSESTAIIGAGMVRHVHSSTLATFEAVIGPTTTSLARRKARLIHASLGPDLDPGPSPYPTVHEVGGGIEVVSHASVFAQGRLDPGTRLMLDSMPPIAPGAEVVDLGCGDGVVGLHIAAAQPSARLTFCDESYMAVASAEESWRRAYGDSRPARFLLGDGLDPVADGSVDVVVVNPPFHDDNAVGDATAWDMFTGARRALRPGGRLVVVGNRHLAYHAKLKRLFGSCRTLASTPKFVVLQTERRWPRQAAQRAQDRTAG